MLETLSQALNILSESAASFIATIPNLLVALVIFYVIYRLSTPLARLVRSTLRRAKRSRNLCILAGRLTRWSVVFAGFLVSATVALPSFRPDELISLLGIGSVAIGFAFRDVLQNFLAGILILLTEPFKIDDQVVVGDYEGTVEDIQIRATHLRTYDNRRVVIPNSEMFTDSVTVNTAYDKRRSEYSVGIGYEDDVVAAQQLCLDVMRETDGVLNDPVPDTIMSEMGDSAVVFRVRWWTNPRQADVLRVQNRVLRRIKNRLTDEGFNIPFPIRTVYFTDETARNRKPEYA